MHLFNVIWLQQSVAQFPLGWDKAAGFYHNLIDHTRSINLYAFNSAPLELASALSSVLSCPPNYSSVKCMSLISWPVNSHWEQGDFMFLRSHDRCSEMPAWGQLPRLILHRLVRMAKAFLTAFYALIVKARLGFPLKILFVNFSSLLIFSESIHSSFLAQPYNWRCCVLQSLQHNVCSSDRHISGQFSFLRRRSSNFSQLRGVLFQRFRQTSTLSCRGGFR